MRCEYCGQDKKHFVVLRFKKDGPDVACRSCYDKMKLKGEIK